MKTKKYTISREKLNNEYRVFFGKDNDPNSAVSSLVTAATEMAIEAYDRGQRGEPLTDLYPWIVEA